jgi:hypothetical protein
VHTEEGRDVVITDGMWVISLGTNGILGLAALLLTLAAPALLLLRRFPARHWGDPRLASAAALACIGLLWSIDNLFNAMMGPVLPAAGGALVSLATARRRARAHPPGTATASAPGPDPATPHEHAY